MVGVSEVNMLQCISNPASHSDKNVLLKDERPKNELRHNKQTDLHTGKKKEKKRKRNQILSWRISQQGDTSCIIDRED